MRTNFISTNPEPDLKIIIVIPCCNEFGLLKTLESLWECQRPSFSIEVLIIFNSSEYSKSSGICQNIKVYYDAQDWVKGHCSKTLKFYLLFFTSLQDSIAGVGYARKIGMDEAYSRFLSISNLNGIIVNLDSDCTVAVNYLTAIYENFSKNNSCGGASIYYVHRFDGLEDELMSAGIKFELMLRYELNFKNNCLLDSHYYFEGFAQAVKAYVYDKINGMTYHTYNEDYIFMQRVKECSDIIFINDTVVYPRLRYSRRTPFGSSSIIYKFIIEHRILNHQLKETNSTRKLLLENQVYNPKIVLDFQNTLKNLDLILRSNSINGNVLKVIPTNIRKYINANNTFNEFYNFLKLNKNEKSNFIDVINLCRNFIFPKLSFKDYGEDYIIFATNRFYPKLSLVEAAKSLLVSVNHFKKKEIEHLTEIELLKIFRKLDKNRKT